MTRTTFLKKLAAIAHLPNGNLRFKVGKGGAIRSTNKHGGPGCLCPIEEFAQAEGIDLPDQPSVRLDTRTGRFVDVSTGKSAHVSWAGYYSDAACALGLDEEFVYTFIGAVDSKEKSILEEHSYVNRDTQKRVTDAEGKAKVRLRRRVFDLLGLDEARL